MYIVFLLLLNDENEFNLIFVTLKLKYIESSTYISNSNIVIMLFLVIGTKVSMKI